MRAMPLQNFPIDSTARFLSPLYPPSTICVQFWYKTLGNSHLNVKANSFGTLSQNSFFTFKGSNGNEWNLGQATVSQTINFQVVFENLVKNNSPTGYTDLDDIEVKFKACSLPASCSFEEDFCGYHSLKDSDFEWIILDGQFGVNQNIWLVPQFDHTIGSMFGHFIYLDSKRNSGLKAKLQSELLVASTSLQCVQFYLFMKNNGGSLNVYRLNKYNSQTENLYTENAANLDNLWYEREVELSIINPLSVADQDIAFTIIFEGISQSSDGGLAIDDIKLYNGKCMGTQVLPGIFDCQNGQIVNKTVVCDFIEDCSNGRDEKFCGTCDFEGEFESCGWSDKSVGSYFWQRNRNGTLDINRPTNDHTFKNKTGLKFSFSKNYLKVFGYIGTFINRSIV